MWKPVRDKDREAKQLIIYYASQGLDKELHRIKTKIKKTSNDLKLAHDQNSTIKKRQRLRTQLDLQCEHRDRIELSLELIKKGLWNEKN